MSISPDAEAHGLALSQEHPFVIRRAAPAIICRGVDHGPERPVHHLVEHRRVGAAVDPAVEVGAPHRVPGPPGDADHVAELAAGEVGERPDGGEGGVQGAHGDVPRGAGGDERRRVGQPPEAVGGGGRRGGAAVDQGPGRRRRRLGEGGGEEEEERENEEERCPRHGEGSTRRDSRGEREREG